MSDLLSRRSFFKKARSKCLPIIAAITILMPISIMANKTVAMKKCDCGGCTTCYTTCFNTCSESCSGGCSNSCRGNCKGDCMGGCLSSCQGGCERSCVTGCQNSSR